MLFYFILLVISSIIGVIFSIIPNWQIVPQGVVDSIVYFINIAYQWNSIFPIDTLFYIFGLFLVIEFALFLFHLLLTFLRWFRIIGG